MKYIVSILLIIGLGYLFSIQNDAYKQKREFIEKCAAENGLYNETQSGWVHATLICTKADGLEGK